MGEGYKEGGKEKWRTRAELQRKEKIMEDKGNSKSRSR